MAVDETDSSDTNYIEPKKLVLSDAFSSLNNIETYINQFSNHHESILDLFLELKHII